MRSRPRIWCTAVLAVVLAGCGGSSAPSLSSFKTGFAHDKVQFRKLGTDLAAALQTARTKSNSQLAAEFEVLSRRATQQSALLRRLKPPAKYKAELDSLTAGIDSAAGDLHAISGAASAGNITAAQAATRALVQHAAKTKAADVALTGALGLPQT